MKLYREAREIYLLLLHSGSPIEPSALAALHRAVGLTCIELGDFAAAEKNILRSIELNRKLAQPMEVIRDQVRIRPPSHPTRRCRRGKRAITALGYLQQALAASGASF
jgi:hypothetical protein